MARVVYDLFDLPQPSIPRATHRLGQRPSRTTHTTAAALRPSTKEITVPTAVEPKPSARRETRAGRAHADLVHAPGREHSGRNNASCAGALEPDRESAASRALRGGDLATGAAACRSCSRMFATSCAADWHTASTSLVDNVARSSRHPTPRTAPGWRRCGRCAGRDVPFVLETARSSSATRRADRRPGSRRAFTLASTGVEGNDAGVALTKAMMYGEPDLWTRLMDRLTSIMIDYLKAKGRRGSMRCNSSIAGRRAQPAGIRRQTWALKSQRHLRREEADRTGPAST